MSYCNNLVHFFIGEYPEVLQLCCFIKLENCFKAMQLASRESQLQALWIFDQIMQMVKKGDELVKVDPDEVQIGDIIVIKAGEKIPLDGKVIEGSSMIDTSALTGESVPREVEVGSDILSGCININGVITAEVTKEFGESTVSKILDLVENASSKKIQFRTIYYEVCEILYTGCGYNCSFSSYYTTSCYRRGDF